MDKTVPYPFPSPFVLLHQSTAWWWGKSSEFNPLIWILNWTTVAMAAPFRVIYFPSSLLHLSYSYTHQCPSQAHHPNSTSLPSLSTSHLLSQTIHPKRPNFYLFHMASSAQAQPIIQEFTPEEQESEMVQDDDVSNTRLLAQNVPWTCTADDLRPLFEQYGTVVEIEVCLC